MSKLPISLVEDVTVILPRGRSFRTDDGVIRVNYQSQRVGILIEIFLNDERTKVVFWFDERVTGPEGDQEAHVVDLSYEAAAASIAGWTYGDIIQAFFDAFDRKYPWSGPYIIVYDETVRHRAWDRWGP